MKYEEFVESKRRQEKATGHAPGDLNEYLFDFQHAIVSWAVRRGRCGIFADTGLGKTLMQLSWADEVVRHTGHPVLILAPLAVSEQTIEQGSTFGIEVCRFKDGMIPQAKIYITNYERMDSVPFDEFGGIVLDESSILKSQTGKTRMALIQSCQGIAYRLSCSATPSPNDFMELGNQCEFLGIMSQQEMLATYFVNDTGDTGTWRLKGWGASKFWEWMGTWAVVIRNPSDIGFDGSAYILPEPEYVEHVVQSDGFGDLFAKPAMTMTERRQAQRESVADRCRALADTVNAQPDEPWLIWCHLNDEAEELCRLIPGAVNVQGKDSPEFKVAASRWFSGHCACDVPEFRDKLAEYRSARAWQKPTSNSITKKTKPAGLQNPLITSLETKSADENICASTQNRTEINLQELQNSRNGTTLEGESNIHKMLILESGSEHSPESGQSKTQKNAKPNGSENTESLRINTLQCSLNSAANAQYVELSSLTGSQSTLTTAMNLERSEDCFAAHAISESGNLKTAQKPCGKHQCICDEPNVKRSLISKARMFGYGLNFQHCARMAFVGLSDSFEQFYQAVRRCYRYGQKRNVQVHIFSAESEGQILANIKRKEKQHHEMSAQMIDHMKSIMDKELRGQVIVKDEYREDVVKTNTYEIHLSDCVKLARKLEDNSVDYSVFSPPFADLFVYSNSDHDMGNCSSDEQFMEQFNFLVAELYRVIKTGHNVSIHCMNLPTTKMRQGFIGLRDFRGDLIRCFQSHGFIYHAEVAIWKDPVVAMQRTKALGLLHKTIRENSTMSRMGLPDYVVTMRKPGDPDPRVTHGDDLPVHLWQKYASPIWDDINQSRTLNKLPARDENDEKHMCPLQLDVIERCIHLWTNPGDLVFSPFTGIGSEGYCAVKMGRRFIGSELKESYWKLACENIKDAEVDQGGLFAIREEEDAA